MKAFLFVVTCIGGILLLGVGLNWFGLITDRFFSKYQEETRHQVYDTSREYQQGTQLDISRYCEQMRTADSVSAKKAVAALIRQTSSTYDGPVSSDVSSCISEANGM